MHLPLDQLEIVQNILAKHIPSVRVVAFGSRVHGKNLKPFSDLDLCLMTKKPIDIHLLGTLKHDFSESDLPIKVDVVDWSAVDPKFQEIISQQCENIQ